MAVTERKFGEAETIATRQVDGRWTISPTKIHAKPLNFPGFTPVGTAVFALAIVISTAFLFAALLGIFMVWTPVVLVLASIAIVANGTSRLVR